MSGGKDGEDVLVGNRIYMGMHMILCQGPVDYIKRMRADKKLVLEGDLEAGQYYMNKPFLFGGYKANEGGVEGYVDFEFGGVDQIPNTYLQSKLGTNISAHRGVVGVVFRRPYLTAIPYVKEFDFRVQRIFTIQDGADQWYQATAAITSDYCRNNFGLYISLDKSGSMYPPYGNRYDTAAAGVKAFLDFIETRLGTNQFDIGIILWSYTAGQTQAITRRGVDAADIQDLKNFLDNDTPGTGTDFELGTKDAAAFFSGVNASWRKHMIFFTDGYPTDADGNYGGSSPSANAAAADTAALQSTYDVETWAFQILVDARFYTRLVDTTPQDDVPLLSGASEDEFVAYMRNAMAPIRDQNPAHIIRECLTNQDWGMGYPTSDIDETSFALAAWTLFEEVFGLSFLWDKQQPLNEFITSVLQHIDAALYVSKTTGKFVLKLIRDDYTLGSLTTLDETNIEDVDDVSRTAFGELVNSVSVVFYNLCISKFDSVNAQDPALVQQQNAVVETTFQYPGITNTWLAARVAERELRGLSQELLSCTVYANREAASLNIGDAFILDWPDYQINSVVMRVQEIAYGDGRTNRIKIKCSQDVFATDAEPYTVEVPEIPDDGIEAPASGYPQILMEAPYYTLVQRLGDTITEQFFDDNPNLGYPIALSGKPFDTATGFDLMIDDGTGYEKKDTGQFSPVGLIYQSSNGHDIDKTSTLLILENEYDLEFVTAPTYCLMGNEIMAVESINENSDGLFEVVVGRGCMDTVPDDHTTDSVGGYVLFWKTFRSQSSTQYTDGELLDIKLLTSTWSDKQDIDSVAADSLLMRSRALLPYPPGDFRINGESYPDFIDTERNSNTDSNGDYFTFTWAHRDRLQQTGSTLIDHTYGDIGPEAGTTYNIRVYDITGGANELIENQTGISGTSHNWYLEADSNLRTDFRVELESERDTLISWQTIKHEFQVFAPRLMEDGSPRLREDGTPRFKEIG